MANKLSRPEKLARLRDMMQTATDLSAPVDYFLDHLAADRKFIERSKPFAPDPNGPIHAALRRIAVQLCGPGTQVGFLMLCQYGKLRHGSCTLGDSIGTVFYHSSIDIGLVAIHFAGQTEIVRFSVIRPVSVPGATPPWIGKGGAA